MGARFLTKFSAICLGRMLVPAACADITGKVVSVTDGDTIKLLDAGNDQIQVRLSGIDAPERGQPYANVSREHLARMVAGKEVRVESDKTARKPRPI
jgi:endonuclease YncB( thermonuclease family)